MKATILENRNTINSCQSRTKSPTANSSKATNRKNNKKKNENRKEKRVYWVKKREIAQINRYQFSVGERVLLKMNEDTVSGTLLFIGHAVVVLSLRNGRIVRRTLKDIKPIVEMNV